MVLNTTEVTSVLKSKSFDVIILDEHLSGNILVKELANNILRVNPSQRIAFTTTNPSYRTSNVIDFVGLNQRNLLLKPFIVRSPWRY
jgi:hypothetical protein